MIAGPLDLLVDDILARSGLRFAIADDDATRDIAYRLRFEAVVAAGWGRVEDFPDGRERDEFDVRAVHLLAWDGDVAVAAGRLVLPPGPLPTEAVCLLTVQPPGAVADVGRMTVASSHRSHGHGVFLALLARLHLEVRRRGCAVACGLVSERARALMRLLGLELEVLGEARWHAGEMRTPVRFAVGRDVA